ncbi:MAG TPA: hypothetical protein VKB58_14550 [Terriglobales bacterium]|jgi:hypothetical protein|nr:hypothetical protein [Terriglobales bacterium]
MEYSNEASPISRISKRAVAYVAGVIIAGGALGGYAVHEHSMARNLAVQNQQTDAALDATRNQVSDLTAKVNAMAAQQAQAQAQAAQPTQASAQSARRVTTTAHRADSARWKKMQAQLDAQGKAIEATQAGLATTQGDLSNTRTELTGSIARTHDELVLLQKKGERNYYEFDIDKSKQFQHDGPFGVRLRKANTKHQYADLELMVDDRNLTQKHVNLYQPVMFYTPDNPQPVELVINAISKDHIHGYVSAPKYRQSELASMQNANANAAANAAATTNQTPSSDTATSSTRQKLPAPQ